MSIKVLILGVNGFIGSALSQAILTQKKNWSVYGMDMATHKIDELLTHPQFHFVEGDITINKEWIAYHIKKCDVVIPLVAIANPSIYVSDPIRVFELDFEENLQIVRQCVHYGKRVVFPSTSEVYGMTQDDIFDEHTSNLTLGPIDKQRWIYSCSKQLLDRVIYAYGVQRQLDYTLFRPFNWIGPKLDDLLSNKEGSARVLTQFISDIINHQRIVLVDGGCQRRSFTDIDDGIDGLVRIIENKDNCASRRIFNLGNPDNNISIKELAHLVINHMKTYPDYASMAMSTTITEISGTDHYGPYYQDVQNRVPGIVNAKNHLGWNPTIPIDIALKKTLDFHLSSKKNNINMEGI